MADRKIVLQGARITLAEMTAEDQPFFHKWHGENPELRALIDDQSIPTIEDQHRWFERSKQPDRKMFSLLTKDGQRLIGHGGLVDIDHKERTALLRITIGDSAEWGKGYGTEATQLIAQYGFSDLHLRSISLRVLATNARAIRSYEKAGFTRAEKSVSGDVSSGSLWMTLHAVERGDVPASAICYVRNGGSHFEKALRSVQFCREHVVLDGGSIDQTLLLAYRYGCRVTKQNPKFLNAEGRIIDFGGVANQAYGETREPWIVLIAADEELEPELVQSMIAVIRAGEVGVYSVYRYFLLDGRVMQYSALTPESHIRLCHREALLGFTKRIHERPVLAPGIIPKPLSKGRHYIPLTDTPAVMKEKYRRYLTLEEQNFVTFGWLRWMRYALRRLLIIAVLLFRMLRIRLLHSWKDCLPLRYDLLNVWYGWQLIKRSCPLFRSASSMTQHMVMGFR